MFFPHYFRLCPCLFGFAVILHSTGYVAMTHNLIDIDSSKEERKKEQKHKVPKVWVRLMKIKNKNGFFYKNNVTITKNRIQLINQTETNEFKILINDFNRLSCEKFGQKLWNLSKLFV